ncbi:hypothetical protein H2198_005441 [Neophaeococcomyces mojaviensis]|uniref:Uncharacterized protein n=1 Tax=Neophaeococcomyces mojaviensis TaxID=3383035 RepID=A0ACC3A5W7_9EURO|nr:hypothetical protein H2198_005441 [Knufia sp. JES_112]
MDLTCEITTPAATHTHTVIFLHGRGDTARNFSASLVFSQDTKHRTLQQIFPSVRWVFPQAEMRSCAIDHGDLWSQWFDVWTLKDFKEREQLQTAGLRESVSSIRKVIRNEVEMLGERAERVVLMGISQGAALGVHALLNLNLKHVRMEGEAEVDAPLRLGALIGFAGWMPFVGRSLAELRAVLELEDVPEGYEVLKNTPVLLEHCMDDQSVGIENGIVMRDALKGFGASVEWKEYTVGGHWFKSPEGIEDAVTFIRNHVPGIPDDCENATS